jgi:hypothetical protein
LQASHSNALLRVFGPAMLLLKKFLRPLDEGQLTV